jgi:pyrroline-5-carboxylate reductase
MKVAVVGAGRLGSLLGARLPHHFRRVIITRQRARAVALADEVGALASDQLAAARGCEAVFLAVPAGAVPHVLEELTGQADPGTLIVNMATDLMTAPLREQYPDLRIVAAKVLGHAGEMAAGGPGAVLLDYVTEEEEALLAGMLGGLGPVFRESEEKVLAAVNAVAEAMVRVEADLQERLPTLGLPPALTEIAVRSTAPGILRSVTRGEAGPFLQEVIRRIRPES